MMADNLEAIFADGMDVSACGMTITGSPICPVILARHLESDFRCRMQTGVWERELFESVIATARELS